MVISIQEQHKQMSCLLQSISYKVVMQYKFVIWSKSLYFNRKMFISILPIFKKICSVSYNILNFYLFLVLFVIDLDCLLLVAVICQLCVIGSSKQNSPVNISNICIHLICWVIIQVSHTGEITTNEATRLKYQLLQSQNVLTRREWETSAS